MFLPAPPPHLMRNDWTCKTTVIHSSIVTKAITAANIIVIYSLDQGLISIPATGLCIKIQ